MAGTLGRAVLTAWLYLLAARLGVLMLEITPELGAVFWPGAGVTVTALLVSPRRSWPAILLAVGATEALHGLVSGSQLVPVLWWAVGNTVEPLVVALLAQRWRADTFDDVRHTVLFLLAAFLGPAVGGLLGALGTVAVGSEVTYAVVVVQWWIGDGLGILTVVPFGLVVTGRLSPRPLRSAEGALVVVVGTLVSLLVFTAADGEQAATSDYLILLPMVWAAVRFRVAGAAVVFFLGAQIGNTFHALGRGPFAGEQLTAVQGSAQLQLFLATVGVTILLLASRTVESETFHDLADAREQLIAAVSHELRTPLTPIIGFSELLLDRDGGLEPQSRKAVEVIHRNGRHLMVLIDDLLHASRRRRGEIAVQPEPVDLGPFVRAVAFERRSDEVEVVSPETGPEVWADPTHVRQILSNLLDNADRHGRPPVHVEVTIEATAARIVVSDEGDGVPPWFVPRLFDEFAQATVGDRRPTLGLGLGLPIARDLADANGGSLRYEAPGEGARFVLTLPLAVSDAPSPPSAPVQAQ